MYLCKYHRYSRGEYMFEHSTEYCPSQRGYLTHNRRSKVKHLTCRHTALAFAGTAHKPHGTIAYICSTVASSNTSFINGKKKQRLSCSKYPV